MCYTQVWKVVRPFCSSCVDKVIQFERCVQCLGNVVVWWCAGNIALYRWESWLDVWGNVARAADCRPVPTATPAMRAWWLRTRSSLAWLMALCLLYIHPAASLIKYHCGEERDNISVLQSWHWWTYIFTPMVIFSVAETVFTNVSTCAKYCVYWFIFWWC